MYTRRSPKAEPSLNPQILRWAREWRGVPLETAAKKVGKLPSAVQDWEDGTASPTLRQARILSDLYDRPFLEFFMSDIPVVPEPMIVPDYRAEKSSQLGSDEDVREVIRWAESIRESALDLFSEIGEPVPTIPEPMKAQIHTDPDSAAADARSALRFPFSEQEAMSRKEAEGLPGVMRRRLESAGVITLRTSLLKDLGIRGICLARNPLPVVVFRNESPAGQAFTIAHEIGHIVLGESGITGPRDRRTEKFRVEKWCDSFAGAFLMPLDSMIRAIGAPPTEPILSIEDYVLESLSQQFKVSQHAMLIRLVQLGFVHRRFYWEVKKPEFDEVDRNQKSIRRAKYFGSRYRSALGDLYTGLVIEAWNSGRITNHNASEYLGIKNLKHLDDVRENFGQ